MSGFSYRGATLSGAGTSGPLTSFGEISVAELTQVGYTHFVYGLNLQLVNTLACGGGSVASSGGFGIASTGASISGSGGISIRRGRSYRPGIGSLGRFTALYDNPVSGNMQLAGLSNIESGYYFGYQNTSFGILHQQESQREVRKLTVTTGSGTGIVTVTLDGVAVSVPITGGSNVNRTSYSLSRFDYSNVGSGWITDCIDGTVYFLSTRPEPRTGSYSVSGNGIAGSFSTYLSGNVGTSTFISQSSFNIDKINGTGPSRFNIQPQSGNVFQIGFQYLGFGNAFFGVEDSETGRITPVHMIKNANIRNTPVLKNPQMSIRILTYNTTNSSSVSIKSLSMAEFIEGKVVKLDPKLFASFPFSSVDSATYVPIGAIKVNRIFNSGSCFGEISLTKLAVSNQSTAKTATIALFRNIPIVGVPNLQYLDADVSMVSTASLNPASDTITQSGFVPLVALSVGAQGANIIEMATEDLSLSAGEILILAIKTSGPVTGEVGISWHEQQ